MTVAAATALEDSFVARALGLTWRSLSDPYDLGVDALAGLALRDNPKRAHLVVSRVLAKHVPADPAEVVLAATRLAALVGAADPVVLGFCETATGLGHLVADALSDAPYVHTTRRPDPARAEWAAFDEEHSHAVGHVLQPDPGVLDDSRVLVLVDDELTSGTTALNTIAALEARQPRERYVLATLLDLRPAEVRAAFEERAARLGVQVDVVALLSGELGVPDDVLVRAAPLQARLRGRALVAAACENCTAWQCSSHTHVHASPARVVEQSRFWAGPNGGRHGMLARPSLDDLTASVAERLEPGAEVLVLGTEELMWLPVRLAEQLAATSPTRVQSTTRSPVLVSDEPGYAVRSVVTFAAPDDPTRLSRVHNLPHVTDLVVVTEDEPAACAGLVEAVRPYASRAVHVVPV